MIALDYCLDHCFEWFEVFQSLVKVTSCLQAFFLARLNLGFNQILTFKSKPTACLFLQL